MTVHPSCRAELNTEEGWPGLSQLHHHSISERRTEVYNGALTLCIKSEDLTVTKLAQIFKVHGHACSAGIG